MNAILALSTTTRITAGIILLTIVGIEYGGWFIMRIVRGQQPMTEFQTAFARAGHGHAGMLVTLALVGLILSDATRLDGWQAFLARSGIALAAIFIPAGFFFSSMGKGITKPNQLIILIYVGMVSLALGVISLGLGLLTV